MENKDGILDKVNYLLGISKNKKYNEEDIKKITLLAKEHSEHMVLGRVFGYSVAEYAIATLKWLDTDRTKKLFNKLYMDLGTEQKRNINELINREIYKEY